MTRTQSALSFMQKKGVDALFAEHHSIKIDEIDEYLLESNIILNEETIFDNAPFDGSLSTEWNKQLKTNKDELGRETIMGLSALAMDKDAPSFLKEVSTRTLHCMPNEIVIPSIMSQIAKEERIRVEPKGVCKDCIFCNIKRGECDKDVWWDISEVNLESFACPNFKEISNDN